MWTSNIIKIGIVVASLGVSTLSMAKDFSWINTRVAYDTTAKELAQKYYGDASDYMIIVKANKGIIKKNHTIHKNTEIKIPITEKFRDQPEILGWN